ncbi:MAG: hypothetical protein FWD04_00170 [Conexibacteraceae bacterium]|nr:hypothetical protein [Conexibacteraceae bacterium]
MSSTLTSLKRILPLIAVLAACVAVPAIASAAGSSSVIKWGKSHALENPNKGGAFDAVSCAPSGGATTTATPTTAATALLCVVGDVKGGVWATAHPSRPASGWTRENIDRGNAITGVSCPTTSFCVAVDAAGQVMHTSRPLGGVKAWSKPVRIATATQPGGGYAGLSGVSCPTNNFCVAVDNAANGQVAYTTDPSGPATAWTLATVATGVTLDSVSCESTTLCVIGGSERFVSVAPTSGASSWKPMGTLSSSPALISGVTCNTAQLCVSVGYGDAGVGLASASSQPSTSATLWAGSQIGSDPPAVSAQLVDGVACPERNLCVAVDGASNVYTTGSPVRGGWSVGKPLKKASQGTASAISCNSTVCVEVDNRGTVTYGAVKAASAATTPTTSSTTKTTTTSTTTKTG